MPNPPDGCTCFIEFLQIYMLFPPHRRIVCECCLGATRSDNGHAENYRVNQVSKAGLGPVAAGDRRLHTQTHQHSLRLRRLVANAAQSRYIDDHSQVAC